MEELLLKRKIDIAIITGTRRKTKYQKTYAIT